MMTMRLVIYNHGEHKINHGTLPTFLSIKKSDIGCSNDSFDADYQILQVFCYIAVKSNLLIILTV